MKRYILLLRKLLLCWMSIMGLTILLSFSKNKNAKPDPGNYTSSFSSDVLDKWMAMQIRLMSTTIASFNGPFVRIYSYSGLAAYEAIFPGIAANSSYLFSATALNNLPAMPAIEKNKKYHWPSSINAALAFMNRSMFPFTSPANKAVMDSLENHLKIIMKKKILFGVHLEVKYYPSSSSSIL